MVGKIYFAPSGLKDQIGDPFPGRRATRFALGYYSSRLQRENNALPHGRATALARKCGQGCPRSTHFLTTVIFTSDGYCFE